MYKCNTLLVLQNTLDVLYNLYMDIICIQNEVSKLFQKTFIDV